MLLLLAGLLAAAPASGAVIDFRDADVAYTDSARPPATGWAPSRLPAVSIKYQNVARGIDPPTVWVRVRFDRAALGPGPVALFGDRMRESYRVYLNGVDLYRTNGGPDDHSFGWHRPMLLPLAERLMRPRDNQLMFRVSSAMARPLSVGTIMVGPDDVLRAHYRTKTVLNIDAPRTIAGVMAILSLGALFAWLVRRQEQVFGWLALVGLIWVFWDLQYFIYSVPVDAALYWSATVDALFLLVWATYGFALTFFAVPRRTRLILCSAVATLAVVILHETLMAFSASDKISFLMVAPMSAVTIYILGRACWQAPRIENLMMLTAMIAATVFGFHDFGYIAGAYLGAGFQLQPYGGFLVFLAFGFALGRRVLVALAAVEDVNQTLALRVSDATDLLGRSEAERRRLEVNTAVDQERERLMREIHDGIGSSLITALAVAQRERQSPNTIATLKRSIADLRIGIDSLEPLGGDVVMLLATLRHRMDRELGDAGLVFIWKAMSAPPLPWLDAVGALHILRILQEAIGNILKHAHATRVEIDCSGDCRDGREGVLITVSDDGVGAVGQSGHGRGLRNMRARAEALNATMAFHPGPAAGMVVALWLPLGRVS